MPDLLGSTLGHYRITEKIGEGGMGVVYRARDDQLGREVAIKLLPEAFAAEPERVERFGREARAAAALTHPNIISIHELGSHGGVPFIVTELLEGSSLRDAMAGGALPTPRALDSALQIAKGLAAAHDRGIIHRDLKPENVFMTRDGTVKILDFGLAKVVPAAAPTGDAAEAATATMHTAAGTVMGTAGYMAPEQLRGRAVDIRSDLFSFGVVLYEMLTGSSPFRRSTAADTASAVLNDEPPALSGTPARVSRAVDEIVCRCLEKRPEDRFQSTAELARALRSAIDELAAGRAAGRRFRPRLRMVAAAVAAGALVIAVAYFGSRWVRDGEEPIVADPAPPRIMVLPFENLGAVEDEFFAAGLSDELTSRLAAVSSLRVVSPGEVGRSTTDILGLGRELEVDYALQGTVRWSRRGGGPQQVRITPKLIRLGDGQLLWSEGYGRQLDDIFEIQSEIAGRVLAALDVALPVAEQAVIEARPTSNMEAYQAYLRGLYYTESTTEEELYLAVSMFEQAVELDPDFAIAHAALSVAHSRLIELRVDSSEARAASAAAAAEKALELDPDLARGHLARAVFLEVWTRDRPAAIAELEIARRGLPNDTGVWLRFGRLLANEGRYEEAVDALERAVQHEPRGYAARTQLAGMLMHLRRHDEADEACRRAIDLHPDRLPVYLTRFWNALAWEGGTGLGHEVLDSVPAGRHRDALEARLFAVMADRDWDRTLELVREVPARGVESAAWWWSAELIECHAYHWSGRREEARRSCERALANAQSGLETSPEDYRLWIALANSHALLGHADEAIRAAERAVEVAAPTMADRSETRGHLIVILAMLGEADRAVEELRAALEQPGWVTRAWIAFDWRYDAIRDDPGFRELTQSEG